MNGKALTGSVRVVSCRSSSPKQYQSSSDAVQIRADRKNAILGNPFVLKNHNDPEERADVIARQNIRVDADMAQGGPISKELDRIASLVKEGVSIEFVCWCAPRHCHADRYAEIVTHLAGLQPTQKPLF